MSITVYTFEDADGAGRSYQTQDWSEAEEYAQKYHLRVIDNTFEWADSERVADYTLPDDEEEDEEPVDCPMCGGLAGILGQLGSLTHYTCRNCGAQFSSEEGN